jgi:ribosomal protein S18 acetylase RimI-like enzyme
MASRRVRMLQREDFPTLMDLETRVFGTAGEAVLGPFYVRLFCEFFAETSFLAVEDGKPVGYILCVLRGKEAYCTTLAVVPEHQGSRVAFDLLRRLIEVLAGRVDSCWFTVKENNLRARPGWRAARVRSRSARTSTAPATAGSSRASTATGSRR